MKSAMAFFETTFEFEFFAESYPSLNRPAVASYSTTPEEPKIIPFAEFYRQTVT